MHYKHAVGSTVRNVRVIETALAAYPVGMLWTVRLRRNGYELQGMECCPHCGVRPRARNVWPTEVEAADA